MRLGISPSLEAVSIWFPPGMDHTEDADADLFSAEDFAAMDTVERASLEPAIIYIGASFHLAPGLAVGEFSTLSNRFDTDAATAAQLQVIQQFHEDLAQQGLQRPEILDADLPALREAADTMCD